MVQRNALPCACGTYRTKAAYPLRRAHLSGTCAESQRKTRKKKPLDIHFYHDGNYMIVFSIQGFFSQINKEPSLVITYLRIMGIAVVISISGIMYNKKASAKQSDIRRCIERHEGVTAFSFYISELCWHSSGPDTDADDAYLVSENILFSVPYEMFNSARRGDYFTGVVVDTGTEKLFYIVNYR